MVLSRKPETCSLEFLGMKKGVDEVNPEQHGDAQANDRFSHLRSLLETRAEAHVSAHQRKEKNAEAKKDEIQHICLRPCGTRIIWTKAL
jgi:hypothetical protein